MSLNTLEVLCRELKLHIEKKTMYMRVPVSIEKRVAVTLWRLATNIEYCTLSALFGSGRSTVGAIVVETTGIIASNLFSRYVSFPTGEKLQDVVANFQTR